jgi:hypothetical protein
VQQEGDHAMMSPVLYLMCDDLGETIKSLAAKNVKCGEVSVAPWGSHTTIPLPSGAAIGLYQPSHRTAHDLKVK